MNKSLLIQQHINRIKTCNLINVFSIRCTVVMNRAEFARVSADHGFLERWSSAAGGTMVYPNSESVSEIIAGLERAQPIIHTLREWIDIIEWKWIVFFVTILLAVEWL